MLGDTKGSKLFQKFQAGCHYFHHGGFGWRLAIYPQQRLCPRLAEKNPTVVFEENLCAIECSNILDAPAGESGRRCCFQSVDNRLAGFDRDVEITAVIMEFAELVPHLANKPCTALSCGGQ